MKNDDLNNRGTRLRDERKRLGINTQDELAEILKVKKNSIVRYEKHNAPLDMDQLDLLEDHGFNIEFILWGSTEIKSSDLPEDEINLLNLYRALDLDAKKGLLLIADTYAQQSKK